MSLSERQNDQLRIFIRFLTDNVPGYPTRRHLRLVNDFCSQVLGREYNPTQDYIHIPAQIDKEHERCWVIFDLNVKERGLNLEQISLLCFRASYLNDNTVFKLLNRNVKTFSRYYPWGGDDEERLARTSDRQRSNESKERKKGLGSDGECVANLANAETSNIGGVTGCSGNQPLWVKPDQIERANLETCRSQTINVEGKT